MIYMDNVSAGVVLPPLVSVSLGWVEPSLLWPPLLQGPSSLDPLPSLPLAPPRLRPLLLDTTPWLQHHPSDFEHVHLIQFGALWDALGGLASLPAKRGLLNPPFICIPWR